MAEFFGQKWGDTNTFGTAGNVVTWSVAGSGIDISGFGFVKSTTSTSLSSFINFNFVAKLRQAFNAWSAISNIEFVQVADGGGAHDTELVSDIRIFGGVMTSSNISGAGFGPSFAPFVDPTSGNITFSSSENWNPDFFLQIALHEIGHALGLDHENDVLAVMNSVVSQSALQPDDIFGARSIYGDQDFAPWVYNMRVGQQSLSILENVSNLTVNGTVDPDVIRGGNGGEVFNGFGGGDTLRGSGGDDELNGGEGNDLLLGGGGSDILRGDNGNDTLKGNAGGDSLFAGGGADLLVAAGGVDRLFGGSGKDVLKGGGNGDELDGGGGNDKLLGQGGGDDLSGGPGNDVLSGGAANDRLDGEAGNDKLKGQGGSDTFVFAAGNDVDKIRDFEDGLDKIDFSSFVFANATQAKTFASDVSGDVVFVFGGGDKLIVENIAKSALSGADFFL